MEVKPSLTAKSMFSSLKLPSTPSFGFQVFGRATAAVASPLRTVRLVIFWANVITLALALAGSGSWAYIEER
jgi:hypothetical protein